MTLKNGPAASAHGKPDPLSGDTEVHSITDAAAAHSEEMRGRMIKYAVAMGIRMVCLVLIFVVDDWFKILPVLGAVFLPWIAVIIANGNDQSEIHSDSLLQDVALVELDAAAGPPGSAPASAGTGAEGDGPITLLQGELIEDDDDEDQGRAVS